jgi:hypothetical protein
MCFSTFSLEDGKQIQFPPKRCVLFGILHDGQFQKPNTSELYTGLRFNISPLFGFNMHFLLCFVILCVYLYDICSYFAVMVEALAGDCVSKHHTMEAYRWRQMKLPCALAGRLTGS